MGQLRVKHKLGRNMGIFGQNLKKQIFLGKRL
jgi:hypothetical protein